MPAVMAKPSFENVSSKQKNKNVSVSVSKEYGEGGVSKRPGGKRSFLQKAKRFGKQGRHGKGTIVDGETYSYFIRVLELLKNDEFDTDDEREALVDNSLGMTEGCEVQLCSNQLVSRVLENLLPLASEERLDKFGQSLTPSLRVLVSDSFASHVLEKMLEITSSDKWRGSEKLTAWFMKTSMFILNNFEDFTFDTYANFVTKKVLECLSGHVDRPTQPDIAGSKGSKSSILRLELYGDRMSNVEWGKKLQEFAKRFAAWPQFNDLGQKVETSRLVQNIIQTVHRTENSHEVLKALILRIVATFPKTLEPDDVAHRIIEVAFSAADEKTFGIIFEKYYKGRLSSYIHGPCFSLQKLISAAPTEQYFITIFEELRPEITSIIEAGKIAVVHNLASQCVKYNTKQKELWKLMKQALEASSKNKENILVTLITLKSEAPKTESAKQEVSTTLKPEFSSTYFGSATVQLLFDFTTSVASDVLQCFDKLTTNEVMKMALDPKASFIISKIFKAWNIPAAHQEKLFKKLQGSLVELATTKFGSRIIDMIWLWANMTQKTIVAQSLSPRISALTANKYSRFMVETMGLQVFIRNQKEWQEHMLSQQKRKKEVEKIASELGLDFNSGKPSEEDTKTAKKANKRKSDVPEKDTTVKEENTETPKKKKKKSRKSGIEETPKNTSKVEDLSDDDVDEIATPTSKKSKKNRKSQQNISPVILDKKKKKNSLSVSVDYDASDISATPNKKNKKMSEGVNKSFITESELDATPRKKKNKMSKA